MTGDDGWDKAIPVCWGMRRKAPKSGGPDTAGGARFVRSIGGNANSSLRMCRDVDRLYKPRRFAYGREHERFYRPECRVVVALLVKRAADAVCPGGTN